MGQKFSDKKLEKHINSIIGQCITFQRTCFPSQAKGSTAICNTHKITFSKILECSSLSELKKVKLDPTLGPDLIEFVVQLVLPKTTQEKSMLSKKEITNEKQEKEIEIEIQIEEEKKKEMDKKKKI